MRQELVGLDVGAVAAALERHAAVAQALREALGLVHHPVHLGLVAHLAQAAGEDLHGAAGHAAVGVQALVDHDLVHELLVDVRIVGGEEAAGVALGVLGAVDLEDVAVLTICLTISAIETVGAARLVLLDVPGVLDDPRAVEDQPLAVAGGELLDRAQVGEAERVLAVGEGLDADERHVVASARISSSFARSMLPVKTGSSPSRTSG